MSSIPQGEEKCKFNKAQSAAFTLRATSAPALSAVRREMACANKADVLEVNSTLAS
jgi:hypothetical protein